MFRKLVAIVVLVGLPCTIVPTVYAQYCCVTTTSISQLAFQDHALIGAEVTVRATVAYSLGAGSHIVVSIYDMGSNAFANGTVTSSPDSCWSQYANKATCRFPVPLSEGGHTFLMPSGTQTLVFILRFYTARTYDLLATAAIEDSTYKVVSGSASTQEFQITISDKLKVTITTRAPITVSVDGSPQLPGSVLLYLDPGLHIISVPSIVLEDNSSRLRFDHWSDGSTPFNRTLNLQGDAKLEAIYVTQYRLNLVSPEANATGAGWYDTGSSAEFSVPNTHYMNGILGLLGGKWVFQGWYDGTSLLTSSDSSSIVINTSHTLSARWSADYMIPIAIPGVIVAAAVGLAYYRKRSCKPMPVAEKSVDCTFHLRGRGCGLMLNPS